MADSPFGSALVIGADAIGGVAAGALGASATSVVVTSDWQEHRAAINRAGLLPIGDEDARSLSGLRAISNNELDALDSQFELIVIATKCAAVASAAQRAADLLTTSGTVLSMTNGVVDADLASALPRATTVIGVPLFSADRCAAGKVRLRGTSRDIAIGGADEARGRSIADSLSSPPWSTTVTRNVAGIQWSKLLLNASINPLSVLTGRTVGEMLDDEKHRGDPRPISRRALRGRPTFGDPTGADGDTGCPGDVQGMSAAAERDDLTTVLESLRLGPGTGFADAISSSLRDYKAGQPTELEWLSGHAEREASRVGVSTPALSEMMRQVRMLESHRNRDKISLSAIREA